jgi:aspartate/methionine/tyrosine aminotransferase
MTDSATLLRDLQAAAPALAACLSDIGRRVVFPKGIPFQARAARGTELNATIGQVTDGAGQPMPLPCLADAASGLDRRQAFLYSPQPGHPAVRKAWLDWQLRRAGRSEWGGPLPFTTHGLTHAIGLIADLFADPDTTVLLPEPAWENYDLLFTMRSGAKLARWRFFDASGALDLDGLAAAVDALTGKAIVVLNFPSNPTGYAPTHDDAARIVEILTARAEPTVVVVDDAYQGVVHTEGRLDHSLFWQLTDAADRARTAVVKVDGATKELLFFPSRIGYLTFDIEDDAGIAAIENKLNALVRGSVGGPPGPSQAIMMAALSDPAATEAQFAERLTQLRDRWATLRDALEAADHPKLRPLPFNAAYFALVGLDDSLDPHTVRERLIADQSVGTIAIPSMNALRIAYCSTRAEDLPEIVRRLVAVVDELSG